MERREFLMTAVLSTAGGSALLGCGGASDAASSGSPAPGPGAWNPSPLLFLAGAIGTFDLATTLPTGVVRGGTFSLAPGSSALPAQIALSPKGILTATSPAHGTVTNVIFMYAEPA